MTPEKLNEIRWLKSRPLPLEFASDRIDRENGILYDVVMAEEGEAKGHGVFLEAEFIEDLVAYDQRHYSKRGLKNRFDHPNGCDTTMGAQMGYFRNFRTRKKGSKMQAIADLHLLAASDLSPTKPNMREWMLQMAEEAPDFVMQSIAFKPGRYYQRDKSGEKKYIWEYTKEKSADGSEYDTWIASDPSMGKIFVEFGKKGEHYYTDTVEAGAATDALFSTEANPQLFVSKALSWLDEHPELKDFARQHPDKVQQFLLSLGIQPEPQKPQLTMSLREMFFGKETPTEDVTITPDELKQLREKVASADDALASATKNLADAQALTKTQADEITQLKAGQKTLEDKIVELQAKIPTAEPTRGPKDVPEEETAASKLHLSDPVTQAAMQRFAKIKTA